MKKVSGLFAILVLFTCMARAQNAPGTPGTPGSATPTNQTTPSTAIVPDRPAPLKMIRVAGDVIQGRILHQTPVVAPPGTNARGTVTLHALIGPDGKIIDLTPLSGPEVLRQAAIESVRQWTYPPYLVHGEAITVDTTISVRFSANKN